MTNEATRARLREQGWRLTDRTRTDPHAEWESWWLKTPGYGEFDYYGGDKLVIQGGCNNLAALLSAIHILGIKVPGFVVTRADPEGIVQNVADVMVSYDSDKLTRELREFFTEEVPKGVLLANGWWLTCAKCPAQVTEETGVVIDDKVYCGLHTPAKEEDTNADI